MLIHAISLLSLHSSCELEGYQIRQINLSEVLREKHLVNFTTQLAQKNKASRMSSEMHFHLKPPKNPFF